MTIGRFVQQILPQDPRAAGTSDLSNRAQCFFKRWACDWHFPTLYSHFFDHCYSENTGTEPLVTLRYFGPDAQAKAPNVGDHKKQK